MTSPARPSSPRRPLPRTEIRSRLGTEFGRLLSPLVRITPGGIAAVLSDDEDEAVDFAHDPAEISALDVQLLAAQVGQSVRRLTGAATRHRLERPLVLLETSVQKLIASTIGGSFTLALLLHHRANIAIGLRAFDETHRRIEALLT